MNELPMWWLILSAIFFATNALLIGALAYAVIRLGKLVYELKPKIESLVDKVDGVTTKVDALTTTVHGTVRSLGERAQGVTGAASSMASTTSKVFERFAPIIGVVLTGLKIMQTINEYRMAHRKTTLPVKKD